jgi:tRNA uridine 5-carboxymethylaminomethyl modification enzyme
LKLWKISNLNELFSVEDIIFNSENMKINGVITGKDLRLNSKCVVISTGTFLGGMVHIGKKKYPAGRHMRDSQNVEPPSIGLSKTLRRLKFPISKKSIYYYLRSANNWYSTST